MKDNLTGKLQFVDQFREYLFENEVILSYRGEISQDIILALLDMTERKLESSNSDSGLRFKIFKVMVGCLQNISFHSEKNVHSKSNVFIICRNGNGYAIYSGNVIRNDKIAALKDKLSRINQMSGSDINTHYIQWLQSSELNDNKAIGLGLMDIARKTGNPLDFDFNAIDDTYSFFSLKTTVTAKI